MKLSSYILISQILFLASCVSANKTDVENNKQQNATNDVNFEQALKKFVEKQTLKKFVEKQALKKFVEKTSDLESDIQEHNVTDVDTIHQMTDNFFRNLILHIPHLVKSKFVRSGDSPNEETSEAIQLMKLELQGLVSSAKQKAEELLAKAKESRIPEGPQIKAMTKDLIQQLKSDFRPNLARRKPNKVNTMLQIFQTMTSYEDFTKDVKELNLSESEFVEAESYVSRFLKEFELEAGDLDKSKSIQNRVTVAKLLGEYKIAFLEDEELVSLAIDYVRILQFRFPEPGRFEVVAKFISGLHLDNQVVQSFFPYNGKYVTLLKEALKAVISNVKTQEASDNTSQFDEPNSNEKSYEDSLRIEPSPQKLEGESNVHNDNAKITLKIDKEYLDALKSLGLKSLKLVLVNVPENNTTDSEELEKNKQVTLVENDEQKNENLDILVPTDISKERRSSESSKNIEHNNNLLRRYFWGKGEKLNKAKIKFSNNMKSQATQKLRQPGFQKFAQVAAEFGMPLRYSDAHKNLDFFWTHPNMDDLDQGMIRDNGFPGESMSEEEESLPYQPRG